MQHAELIVAYLRGELSGQQVREFKEQLATDQELQSAVRDYQIILEGFKGMKHESFHREVAAWDVEADPEEDSVQIMAYLEERLGAADRALFEQRISREPALAEALTSYRSLLEGFKGMRQDDFAAEIREWANELPVETTAPTARVVSLPAKRRTSWWRYAAAAVLPALVAASIWVFNPFTSDNALTAFQENNYIGPAVELIRGKEAVLSRAERSFAAEDFPAAVALLQSIPTEDSLFVIAQYLQGHSFYQMGEYRQAVAAFTRSLEPPAGRAYDLTNFNRDNAAWTRILAQLALVKTTAPGTDLQQDLQSFLSTFLQRADRSDTYYSKGLELQQLLEK